jgi:hypothetical protein
MVYLGLPFFLSLVLLIAGCATVDTQVVRLDPAHRFAPSPRVEILLEKPRRSYTQIALLESHGTVGGSEAELLEDARRKAQQLGADAIVKLESALLYQQPVMVYDPWYDPPYYRYPFRPFYGYPMFPGEYRLVGGGHYHILKALAIKYESEDRGVKQ